MATLLPRSNLSSKVPQAVSPAHLGHRTRRQTKRQRKTGSYTALTVASRWPPYHRRQIAAMLSAPLATHDYQSTTCMEC